MDPITQWLLDYIAMMEADLERHANPVGLHRATVNRRLQRQIAEVRAHLVTQERS